MFSLTNCNMKFMEDRAGVGQPFFMPITSMDLYATISDLAGVTVPLPEDVESASLAPLLHNSGQLPPDLPNLVRRHADDGELYFHDPHYGSTTELGPRTPASAIRDGNYKLVRRYGENGGNDQIYLFDLAADITESIDPNAVVNLADDTPGKTAQLRAKLDPWLEAVDASFPYQVWDEVKLAWDAGSPGTDAGGWRSVTDVQYLDRERWSLPITNPPVLQAVSAFQDNISTAFHFDGTAGLTRNLFHVSDAKRPDEFDGDRSAYFEFSVRFADLDQEHILFETGDTNMGLSLTVGDADGLADELRFRALSDQGNDLTVTTQINRWADPVRDFI